MQLGAVFPQTEIGSDPAAVRDFAQAVEAQGYDYLTAYDHVLGADPAHHTLTGPYTYETMFHEVFVLFGYFAALTRRVQLVTTVLILPQRQTALVAKQAAEVDVLSGGRMILGIGTGWNQVEYASLGQDFHVRGRRSEEQIALLRALWAEPLVNFEGRFDGVRQAGINPLPPKRRIPIWIGGRADAVLERVGRIGDGWLGWSEAGLAQVQAAARAAGRDPAEISIAAQFSYGDMSIEQQVEHAEERRRGGVTHLAMTTMGAGFGSLQEHIDAFRAFREACPPTGRAGR